MNRPVYFLDATKSDWTLVLVKIQPHTRALPNHIVLSLIKLYIHAMYIYRCIHTYIFLAYLRARGNSAVVPGYR